MCTRTATSSAWAAMAIAVTALVLSVLSLQTAAPSQTTEPPVGPSAIGLSLIITGVGPAGEPAKHHVYYPQMIVVRRGDRVRLRVMNMTFASHAIEVQGYGVRTGVLPGGPKGQETLTLVAERAGVFAFRCYVPFEPRTGTCSPDHETMVGYLMVLEAAREP